MKQVPNNCLPVACFHTWQFIFIGTVPLGFLTLSLPAKVTGLLSPEILATIDFFRPVYWFSWTPDFSYTLMIDFFLFGFYHVGFSVFDVLYYVVLVYGKLVWMHILNYVSLGL